MGAITKDQAVKAGLLVKGDYNIGYCKPPKETQFKPGQSGNPKGRPKPKASLHDVVLKQIEKLVTVQENGKVTKSPMKEVLIKSLLGHAIKGKHHAAKIILSLADAAEAKAKADREMIGADVHAFEWSDDDETHYQDMMATAAEEGLNTEE